MEVSYRRSSQTGKMKDRKFRVLVVTDSWVSDAHGTGVALLRNLKGLNNVEILNAYTNRRGKTPWETIRLDPSAAEGLDAGDCVRLKAFSPDFVYSVGCGFRTLKALQILLYSHLGRVPYVQHFVDLIPGTNREEYHRLIQDLSKSMAEIWALTNQAKATVENWTGRKVVQYPLFSMELPEDRPNFRIRDDRAQFKCSLVGNVWNTSVFDSMVRLWSKFIDEDFPIAPIAWYCHPEGVERLKRSGISWTERVVQHLGFAEPGQIGTVLSGADAGLVPFNASKFGQEVGCWEEDYVRGSLPSKILDYCSAALPVLFLGTPDTDSAKYVQEHGIGLVVDPGNIKNSIQEVKSWIDEPLRRECMAAQAWNLAVKEFESESYAKRLLADWRRLAEMAPKDPVAKAY
jgi:glycosyltransferase involved in cell wall biosynthesis